MNIKFNWLFKMGCLSMGSIVLLGARFGHAGQLSEEGAVTFSKAQLYNMSNSIGFFASSLVASNKLAFRVAVGGFLLGQLLFTVPLYISAIRGKDQILSKMMPWGGGSMLIAWPGLVFS